MTEIEHEVEVFTSMLLGLALRLPPSEGEENTEKLTREQAIEIVVEEVSKFGYDREEVRKAAVVAVDHYFSLFSAPGSESGGSQ